VLLAVSEEAFWISQKPHPIIVYKSLTANIIIAQPRLHNDGSEIFEFAFAWK